MRNQINPITVKRKKHRAKSWDVIRGARVRFVIRINRDAGNYAVLTTRLTYEPSRFRKHVYGGVTVPRRPLSPRPSCRKLHLSRVVVISAPCV